MPNALQVGMKVFVKNIGQEGIVQSIRLQKGEAEVQCGNIKVRSKISDLAIAQARTVAPKTTNSKKWKKPGANDNVQVTKKLQTRPAPMLEINVIGLTVHEALPEIEAFLDAAVIANLEELRIVHGMGTGKLRAGIHDYSRKHPNVAEYRLGKYGEGDTGVTILKLK